MSRRIEIELTSQRPDGSWTWRAAGAREPKGEMAGDLIAFAAKVGDELTVEAEFHMDGIEIIEAFEPKIKRPLPETLEILGSGRDQPLVTTQLVANRKGRDRDRDSGDRRGRQDRRGRGDRRDRDRQETRRDDDRPKAKRLRPARTHRQALIDSLPEEQKLVAEKMMRDGVASVEQALRDQRKKARDAAQAKQKAAKEAPEAEAKPEEAPESEAGAKPEEAPESEAKAKPPKQDAKEKKPSSDPADEFLAAAGKLLPRMRSAEWRDRVEAALAEIDDVDLRDLRSVVVASENGATDEETKAMAEDLRNKLTERVDREHAEWLAEVAATLADGRMVRALRLSSRPPKAGVPLPQDIVNRLTEAANAALASDTPPKRWITVLGAVAFSPVRRTVQPQGVPENPDKELLAEVTKLSERVPHIAALFGVEPTPPPRRSRRGAGAQAASRS
ncbi:hypothetical protein [Candidatus Poriferisocius sp.]|uniref:hypothetical protein n=1 Tax=Candidatus Poriferisocius sp. TaxID=3101276 RepID=UPI003B5168E8